MGSVHVRAHGEVPPERFVAALTDFGPGREEVWGNRAMPSVRAADGPTWWSPTARGAATST
jgi:hypothetical protein